MNVPFLSLKDITDKNKDELLAAVTRVVESGWYLQGKENEAFEKHFAEYIGTKYCVGVANGLDALIFIFRAYIELGLLKEGDEVIVPANTYIASILSITENNLKPILVEPDINTYQIDPKLIEEKITDKTKAILIVHLYGRCAYNAEIERIVKKHGLYLFEDNAQAHGCMYNGARRTGSLGDASAHSFYPGKNLGAFGDAGAITTDNKEVADVVRALANYGSYKKYYFRYKGKNSRLDEINAAVLDVKLKYLDGDNGRRVSVAEKYCKGITNSKIILPSLPVNGENVFHIFPIRTKNRDGLQKYLADNGIGTIIHYPIPPHKQEAYKEWNDLSFPISEKIHEEELSLPMSPTLTDEQVDKVIDCINKWE